MFILLRLPLGLGLVAFYGWYQARARAQHMDLFDDDKPESNAPEFTVSDLTGAVKKTLEGAFGRVRVRGEIGRVVTARSGHVYYDLKDERNVISCTTWKGQVAGLGDSPVGLGRRRSPLHQSSRHQNRSPRWQPARVVVQR